MLTVEIKDKTWIDPDGEEHISDYIIVNGIADEESFYIKGEAPTVHLRNGKIFDILNSYSFKTVSEHLIRYAFYIQLDHWTPNSCELEIVCGEYYHLKVPYINFKLSFENWEHWSKPWSMLNVATELCNRIQELENEKIRYWQEDDDTILNGFGIKYYASDSSLNIQSELDKSLHIITLIIKETIKSLIISSNKDTLSTYFHFPEETKTACIQYLVYFAQFLADIGISVDTEIKEEINQTLFKVSPHNKNQSLEQIREALEVYLKIPGDKTFEIEISRQTDIAARQFESNVYHLKSQLLLAQSVIQAKDATIEMLQLSNYQYKQHLEIHAGKESDKEDVIKGIVAVMKYEGKGFSINLPEILRRLKRKLTK